MYGPKITFWAEPRIVLNPIKNIGNILCYGPSLVQFNRILSEDDFIWIRVRWSNHSTIRILHKLRMLRIRKDAKNQGLNLND